MQLLGFVVAVLAASSLAASNDIDDIQRKLDSDLQWGTYRPNLYFGTRPRLPSSLLSGLIWFGLDNQRNWQNTRHSCELGDNLLEYGYSRHNGRDFGEQLMVDQDQGVEIKSEFIKVPGERGGSWAVRFSGRTLEENVQGVSLAYYFGLEGNGTMALDVSKRMAKITGETPDLGPFRIRIVPAKHNQSPPLHPALQKTKGIPEAVKIAGIAMDVPKKNVWRARDLFQEKLIKHAQQQANAILKNTDGKGPLTGSVLFQLENEGEDSSNSNLFFVQMMVHGEFAFDVIYECEDTSAAIKSGDIGALASNRRKEFDIQFDAVFGLREKGFDEEEVEIAQKALSSLIGGIGYFYGSSLVSDEPKPEYGDIDETSEPRLSNPYSLFAGTPSRPFFPRGFLWDEGFQLLLLSRWDADLSMDVLRSWYHTMDKNGWMAREQILGEEARSKVPKEFQIQYPNFANPPTLLFAVQALVDRLEAVSTAGMVDQLAQVYSTQGRHNSATEQTLTREYMQDLLQYSSRQLEFFMRTQAGEPLPGSLEHGYRWRGRTMDHTLTSGIDDYPRARPPSTRELHVDLFSWVTYMLSVDTELAAFARNGLEPNQTREQQLELHLQLLDELHWNSERNMYCDVTVQPRDGYDELEDEGESEESVFVCHKGYVSLFPMLLGLVPPESPKMGHILDMIEDPDELWSEFGIRSLSTQDEFYGKGEDYWRGPIWININYLVLSSLHKHYMSDGPHQEQANRIYSKLRQNLVRNILDQFRQTRFFWEQYNPHDGHGQGTHPFTGWTSLVVLIMAEKY
ncbi:Processing alpha glucosidase I [Coemansia sp. RSA 520]|nr:Processing alpha glucosidase I [Coemansia sp. RSA 520]